MTCHVDSCLIVVYNEGYNYNMSATRERYVSFYCTRINEQIKQGWKELFELTKRTVGFSNTFLRRNVLISWPQGKLRTIMSRTILKFCKHISWNNSLPFGRTESSRKQVTLVCNSIFSFSLNSTLVACNRWFANFLAILTEKTRYYAKYSPLSLVTRHVDWQRVLSLGLC